MLITALADFYDCLRASPGKLPPKGYSFLKIDYVAVLSPEGELTDILPNMRTELRGKKEVSVPQVEIYPEREETTKTEAYYLEHRPAYLFGFEWDDNAGKFVITKKAKDSHKAFVKTNLPFFWGIDSPGAIAFVNFMERWVPAEQIKNPLLLELGKESKSLYFAFCPDTDLSTFLNRDKAVIAAWEKLRAEMKEDTELAQCSVCGEILPIARLHDKIKLPGGKQSKLVSFKNPSETSYGLSQSYNSSVSQKVMKKYTAALNYILASSAHHTVTDDLTICYWAQTNSNEELYAQAFSYYAGGLSSEQAQLGTVVGSLTQGKVAEYKNLLEDGTDFYVVGMTPNSARISVKFFYRQKFGEIMEHLEQHRKDVTVSETQRQSSVYRYLYETKSPKSSNEKLDPGLAVSILQAALSGGMYPRELLDKMLIRVKTDQDTDKDKFIKFNDVRVGAIKAYLNRKSRLGGEEERITMSLNQQNERPGYLCGRLFAVLERAQKNALGDVNATIRDKFFASACSTPALVFPQLMKLAQYHIAKDDKYGNISDRYIETIVDKLTDGFPKTLDNEAQGEFIIGYYQQRSDFYKKNEQTKESK